MIKKRIVSFAILLGLLVPPAASAQEQYVAGSDSPQWLKDRRYNEGEGIRAGDLEIHPGVAAEFGYDSNWFLRSENQSVPAQCGPALQSACNVDNGPPLTPPIPALELRISPSLYVSTLGPQRREGDLVAESPAVAFRAGVNATYREFFGVSNDPVASQPQNDIARQRNVGGTADLRLDILPDRPVGGGIFASYGRIIQPNYATADPNLSFVQDNITAGAEVVVQPGGGTLDWRFGYQLHDYLFEASQAVAFDTLSQEAFTRGRWRFRPRTALIYDGTLDFLSYSNSDQALKQGLVGSMPVRARIGLNGLVTERFAALLMVGWGASFEDTTVLTRQTQYDSVIGQAELKWFLTASPGIAAATQLTLALSTIAVGYRRDFQTSYLGNYYGLDRGYLRFNYFFGGRALVTLEGGLGAIEYPLVLWGGCPAGGNCGPVDTANLNKVRHDSFTDLRADATLFGEYRLVDSFGINATLRYTQNVSNNQILDAPNGIGVVDMSWNRFEAFLGLRWFM
jgi:hypothetical protein